MDWGDEIFAGASGAKTADPLSALIKKMAGALWRLPQLRSASAGKNEPEPHTDGLSLARSPYRAHSLITTSAVPARQRGIFFFFTQPPLASSLLTCQTRRVWGLGSKAYAALRRDSKKKQGKLHDCR